MFSFSFPAGVTPLLCCTGWLESCWAFSLRAFPGPNCTFPISLPLRLSKFTSRMWSGGAELTRDLWLANGRKDAATYQLTRVSKCHQLDKRSQYVSRRGRKRVLTFWSARLSPSLLLHLSIQPGSCQVILPLKATKRNTHQIQMNPSNTNSQGEAMLVCGTWPVTQLGWSLSPRRTPPTRQTFSNISKNLREIIWPSITRQTLTNIPCLGTSATGKKLF